VELPVHALRESLLESVHSSGRLLLRAPTGSGKSTCVPPMLLDGGVEGLIVVVQPRRIAARMLARHVASLRGVRHGSEVGHVVRFENCMGKDTRIVYVTDGVLQRWLQEQPGLPDVGAVIFDEFHERRIASDVALARCLELQEGDRPDLKLVVMSATLEVVGLQDYLEPCDILEAQGRAYPVDITYRGAGVPAGARATRGGGQELKVWDRVAEVVKENVTRDDVGHVLCFYQGFMKYVGAWNSSSVLPGRGAGMCVRYTAGSRPSCRIRRWQLPNRVAGRGSLCQPMWRKLP